MRTARRSLPRLLRVAVPALGLAAALSLPFTAHAAPVLGFVENFPAGSLQGWGGGAVVTNPGTGGFHGPGDGFLRFSTPNGFSHNLGARSFGAEYVGNFAAAGITEVRLWLNDVDADDPLEMHFSIGGNLNLWQYNVGFLPPEGEWAEFVVDLGSDANWTQLVGPGTFAGALQAASLIHVRHDHAPFVQTPDMLDGDVGLDRILLTNGVLGVPPGGPRVPRALVLAAPAPNPSRGSVILALETFEPGAVRIEIVDAAGRMVRTAELADAAPGARRWTWDGLDASGRRASPGYYRVRAVGRSGGMSRGLILID